MKAPVLVEPGVLELQERPEPAPPVSDEVLVEVEFCGLCGSDVQAISVPPGHPSAPGVILGHEIVGRIADRGPDVRSLEIGRRVVLDPDPSCGLCRACRRGLPAACERTRPNGVYVDGGLARLCKVREHAVFPIAEHVDGPVASLAEPLACVVNGVRRADVQPGECAVIFGAGAIGAMFAALLRAAGAAPVVVVEPSEPRRRIALEVGAQHAVTPEEFERLRSELLPFGADVVVDAVGSVLARAIETTTSGGRVILIGMDSRARASVAQNELTARSLSIIGSYVTHFTFPAAVELLERGEVDLAPLVTHQLPLDATAKGIELLRTGEALKVVIAVSAELAALA
jgi:threonine dehydrogenase-like Zn-dependent dehydrogenase